MSENLPGEMLLETLEGIKQILEVVDLYRDECLRHGYSPTAAEQMALGFHQMLLLTNAAQAKS